LHHFSSLDAKYHGKLYLIRGKETFRVHSPFHPRLGYTVRTDLRMDLVFKNDSFGLRYCNGTWTANRCATEALGLDLVGSNWKEIMENMKFVDRSKEKVSYQCFV
jgi:hypothetical protein